MKIIVLQSQSFIDLAIQELGSAEAAYELAQANGMSVTNEPGAEQELAGVEVVDQDVRDYFFNKNIHPATDLTVQAIVLAGVVDSWVRNPIQTELNQNGLVVMAGQTAFDLAIQSTGSAEAAFDLALENGFSITDDLSAGLTLIKPHLNNKQIAAYYQQRGIKPATGLTILAEQDEYRIFDYTFDFTFN